MAGEMSREEVTRESYPDLFELRDALAAQGIESEPRPFDQYQGPYLYVPGVCRAWYDGSDIEGISFVIERGFPPTNTFERKGSDIRFPATDTTLAYGSYLPDSAVARIVALAKIKP